MLKFAVNLTLLFTEVPFSSRFERAANVGFRFVEFHNPYPYCEEMGATAQVARSAGMQVIHMNLPAGDWLAGERGFAALPEMEGAFHNAVTEGIQAAQLFGARQLNCPIGFQSSRLSQPDQFACLVGNLRYAAKEAADAKILLLVEPLSAETHPGYFLTTIAQAVALQDAVGMDNLKIQYDFYQMRRVDADPVATIRCHQDRIGFIQIADYPGRGQPGTGEIDFRLILRELDEMNFTHFVSLEYLPAASTESSLRWMAEYGYSP